MISVRNSAILATVLAATFGSAPAFACRMTAVEGFTGGPSVIRVETRAGRSCAIPHYTVVRGRNGLRAIKTLSFQMEKPAAYGNVRVGSNRVVYRGRGDDRFAYGFTDRVGYDYDVYARVIRR